MVKKYRIVYSRFKLNEVKKCIGVSFGGSGDLVRSVVGVVLLSLDVVIVLIGGVDIVSVDVIFLVMFMNVSLVVVSI